MKYAHILGAGGMYTKDFCKMLVDHFDIEEHQFISGDPMHPNYRLARESGCRVNNTVSIDAIKCLRKCDCVIAHGMINPKVLALFWLWPSLLKKTNWVIWGGDVYDHSDPKRNCRDFIISAMRKSVYPKVKWVTTLSRRDYEYACKKYGLTALELEGCYPVPASTNSDMLKGLRNRRINRRDLGTKTIQVGNSATESNQHFDALDTLAQYKDKDVTIFLPLNYGPAGYESYASEVIAHAEKIFGKDRVVALREQVSGAEYLELLSKVDVGVFNNNRQQAMGNISQLILLGAKVYIRSDVSMWSHFESLGCLLDSFESIASRSFDDFVKYDVDQRDANISIIEKRHAIEEKVRTWSVIFKRMEEGLY